MADMNITQDKKSVPAGFKVTEIGVIPEDWTYDYLERVCPAGKKYGIVDGPFGSNLKTEHYKKSGIPIISSGFVTTGQFLADEYIFVDKEKFRQEKRSAVAPGDIVMAKIGARCGASAILPIKHEIGILSGNALKITVNENKHETYFIWQLLWDLYSKGKFDDITAVGAQPAISMPHLKKLLIPLPTKSEQTVIANVLSDTDALIAELEQLIAKKQAIKTATMQQLLTGDTRLPQFAKHPDGTLKGYKICELGKLPEDWTVLTYGEIFDFLSTSTNARADLSHNGEYGYIHYGDIHTKWNNKLDASAVKLPKISKKLVSSSFLENGDVIMADASEDYSGIGKSIEVCNIGNKKIVAGLHTYLLRDKYKQLSDGYRGYLHSNVNVKKIIDQLATGMKVFGISKNNLLSVPVPVPPKQEQTAIATILSDMDAELTALERKLAKVRDIKQGMMQQLLTGRIRLPLDHQP
ncbi:restriction endonuclease subunit S [Serratia marcescens]|uniref:restriction endonuclease subunit S n=1 Tax=Escherichia coli TaxID=562 RepID=UPI0003EFB113|nr:restriction endonuclease subunit S [Escherichia coli]EHR8495068.1 restriction endonuclease subunit S [Escherichia coli]MCO0146925.1 restriction endonuclease subunit S [Escherichia coli]HBP4330970.1 restriction endonuclease subunit S [Escherichia coli]